MSKQDEKNEFPKKYKKILEGAPEFVETADAADVDSLKAIIVQCENNIYNSNKEKSEHIKLNAAKELVKDFSAPFSEAMKYQQAKIQYALFLLQNKGVDLGESD